MSRNRAVITDSNELMKRIWIEFKPIVLAVVALVFMTLPALLAFAGS